MSLSGSGGHLGVAVVPVRAGRLPIGAAEAAAEAGGRVVLIGSGAEMAVAELSAALDLTEAWTAEIEPFDATVWTEALVGMAPVREADVVVLAASPDGRDLAPRLAHRGGRSLYAGVVSALGATVSLIRFGGRATEELLLQTPAVVTMVAGTRGYEPATPGRPSPRLEPLAAGVPEARSVGGESHPPTVEVVEVTPPDPATMDLAESPFIVAGGMGLGDAPAFAQLGEVAGALGASLGATRVVTDAGWAPFERQIGTTGVAVDPRVYVAFGISGAVQHTSGLGDPDHIISVNLDPSCPMMALAELAIVADAPAVVVELAGRLVGRV